MAAARLGNLVEMKSMNVYAKHDAAMERQYQAKLVSEAQQEEEEERLFQMAEQDIRSDPELLAGNASEKLLVNLLTILHKHHTGVLNIHEAMTALHVERERAIKGAAERYAAALKEYGRRNLDGDGDLTDFVDEL
jgi:hypothetical protein